MKNRLSLTWIVAMVLLLTPVTVLATEIRDDMHFSGPVRFSDTTQFGDTAYTWPSTDGSNGQHVTTDGSGTLSWGAAGSTTAYDDIGDPDADSTIAFGDNETNTWTMADTDEDMFTIQGTGAFGDVSVMRVEQVTGNATNGTVFEIVAADDDVDPLVVSASNLSNAFVVGQDTGDVTVNGPFSANGVTVIGDSGDTVLIDSSDWGITTAGAISGVASVTFDNGTGLYQTDVTITAAEVKDLVSNPKELIAGVGSSIIEFVSAVFILNYGSEIFAETTDNLVIEYEDGRDITGAIEMTGFIDQSADQVAIINAADIPTITAANSVNKAVQLLNTDGDITGNASNDSVLTLKVTYRLHTAGL